MKSKKLKTKIITISVSLLALLLLVAGTTVFLTKPTKANSMIGMNEGYGTTITDNASPANVGTITNALWKPTDDCLSQSCLFFDGTGDYVSFGDNGSYDFAGSTSFTIELWFKTPDITSGTRILVGKYRGDDTEGGYKIYMTSDGKINFGIDNDNTGFPSDVATSQNAYDDSRWHHISAVKTGAASITLYIDAQRVGEDAIITSATLENDDDFTLGMDSDGSSNPYTGFLDELRIFTTTARTADQVKTDATKSGSSDGTSASFGPDTSTLNNGLVGYWKLDEYSSGAGAVSRIDSSGNGNTMTDNGTTASTTGKFGNASSHVYGNEEYLSITDATQKGLEPTTAITLSAWTNRYTPNSFQIMSKQDFTTNQYKILHQNDAFHFALSADGTNFTTISSANNKPESTWHHVVGTWDGSYIRMYVNGVEDATPVPFSGPISGGAGDFEIGAISGSYEHWAGFLDDVRVYNRALSSAEVTKLYQYTPGPVGYWKFDENTGTDTNDISGNGNTLTLTNSPSWTVGKFNSGILLTGSDAQLTRSDDPDFDFVAGSSFTISTWFKHSVASAQEIIISKYQEAGYKIIMEADGDLTCGLDYDSAWTPTDSITSTAATYDDGNWHYISCVKNTDSSLSLYIDGVLIGSDSSLTASTLENADALYIGIDADGTSNDFIGSIDDTKIYSYARTPAQIIQDMNAGHPAPGSPVGSSVTYWKFDEGYGTTANDSTPNQNNLTLNSASWTASGKFGSAWNGTGGNIRLSKTTDPDLEFGITDDFTLSAWYKSDSANNPAATEYLMSNGGPAGSAGYALYATTAGLICVGIDDDTSWDPDVVSCTTNDLYDATWHHITAKRDVSADTLSIYIDGIRKDYDTDSTTATLDSDPTFYLGDIDTDDAGSGEEFAGDLDDIKIFRSALSDDQIKQLITQSSSGSLGSLTLNSSYVPDNSSAGANCVPGDTSTCTAPVLDWTFAENTGQTLNDISGNSNHGTLGTNTSVGTDDPSWQPGLRSSNALVFDGTADFVKSTSTVNLSAYNKLTVEFWGYWNSFSSNGDAFLTSSPDPNANTGAITILPNSDFTCTSNFELAIYGGGSNWRYECFDRPTANAWHHYAAVFDHSTSTGDIKFFVDGVQQTMVIGPGTTGGSGNFGNYSWYLMSSLAGTDYFGAGKIQGLKIYPYERTSNQVNWDFNRGRPIGWFKLDECSGDTINNSAPLIGTTAAIGGTLTIGGGGTQTAAGTCLTSGAWFNGVNGKYSASLNFDGDDYARDNGTILATNQSYPFSLSAWIKTTAAANQDIVSVAYSVDDIQFAIMTTSTGKAALKAQNTTLRQTNGTSTINDGNWHMITGVFNSTTSREIYVDGIRENTGVTSVTFPIASKRWTIGATSRSSITDFFTGQIDDARIYQTGLTPIQIKTLFNENSAVRF